MRIIDAHVHFVDLSRPEGVTWPVADGPLFRNFLPSDLQAEAADSLHGCILVETSPRPSDNEWMLQLAEQEPMVLAVVANLDPGAEHFQDRLSRLLQREYFAGLRLRPIEQFNLGSSGLTQNLEYLGAQSKTIELGATTTDLLYQYTQLAKSIPGTRCILDHLGHPRLDGTALDREWMLAMQAFAAMENTSCKVSGLMGLARHRPATARLDFYQPVLEFLYATFGPERLLFGSNWPPASTAGNYLSAVQLLHEFFAAKGELEADQFFFRNACSLYRLCP